MKQTNKKFKSLCPKLDEDMKKIDIKKTEKQKENFMQDVKSEIDNNIESLNRLKKALETGYITYETNRA